MADNNLTSPGFGPRLQDLARRLGIAGFWSWWNEQLKTLVPAAPRAAMARRRMKPVLVFESDHATLWRPALEDQRAVMKPAATIRLIGDAADIAGDARTALAPLARMEYGGVTSAVRVVIALRQRDVLRRRITLPLAVEENLRQALAYDLDRHTPFKAEELYFDAVTVDRNVAAGTIVVDLAAARRVVVDPMLKQAAGWGVQVVAVVPEPPATAASSRLNLMPLESRHRGSFWNRWQFWLPLALFVMLVFAAVLIPLWQKRDYAIALNVVVDQGRTQASVSEKLREELEARIGDYNVALERKYAFPGALQVVDSVSRLLPDDTWLTQFELKSIAKGKETQRELLVRGETANAGRLVQLFEESQMFAQAAPRSPTTKIQPGPGEIFDLGAQLKPLPTPTRLPIAGGANGATPNPPITVATPPGGAGTPATVATPAASPPTPAPAAAAPATAPAGTAAPAPVSTPARTAPSAAATPTATPSAPTPARVPTPTAQAPAAPTSPPAGSAAPPPPPNKARNPDAPAPPSTAPAMPAAARPAVPAPAKP